MKYISKSGLSCASHAANDSSKKLFSASMLQLHNTFLFNNMYRWLGILTGILLL